MRWKRVCIESVACELAPRIVASAALEERLAPLYDALRIPPGQIEALTGIRERRFWDPGTPVREGALRAGRKALALAGVDPSDVSVVIYGGVCRDDLEPATATAVAHGLGVSGDALVYDISNACLGVLNGMIEVANRIELGQARAGIVVSCESAREITDIMIDRLVRERSMERFRTSLATLTGGSGAAAVVLTDADISDARHRLRGGAVRAAPEHHRLCRWGPESGLLGATRMVMETDASAVLANGVALGVATWRAFLAELGWSAADVSRVFCHQVGSGHRAAILKAFEVPIERDFSTYETLGNMGTVALPATLAIGIEQGVLRPGDRAGLLGIGSGLNCIMLGVEW